MLVPPRYAGITGSSSTAWRDRGARAQLPAGLPLQCTQGPGDMLLLPANWGHATANSAFAIGVGNLYCDVRSANYTDDRGCHAFYPKHVARRERRNPSEQKPKLTNLERLIARAVGFGSHAWPVRDGKHDWRRVYEAPYVPPAAPPDAPASTASASVHHAPKPSPEAQRAPRSPVNAQGGRQRE